MMSKYKLITVALLASIGFVVPVANTFAEETQNSPATECAVQASDQGLEGSEKSEFIQKCINDAQQPAEGSVNN